MKVAEEEIKSFILLTVRKRKVSEERRKKETEKKCGERKIVTRN